MKPVLGETEHVAGMAKMLPPGYDENPCPHPKWVPPGAVKTGKTMSRLVYIYICIIIWPPNQRPTTSWLIIHVLYIYIQYQYIYIQYQYIYIYIIYVIVLDHPFPINLLLNRSQSSVAHLVPQGIHAAAERQLGGQHAADLALKVRDDFGDFLLKTIGESPRK